MIANVVGVSSEIFAGQGKGDGGSERQKGEDSVEDFDWDDSENPGALRDDGTVGVDLRGCQRVVSEGEL